VVAGARATATADRISYRDDEKGGLRAALFPNLRRLGIEAIVIVAVVVTAGYLIVHFGSHTVRNQRPLAGANVDVSHKLGSEATASFTFDPTRPGVLVGTTNQRVYVSHDDGRRWQAQRTPAPKGACLFGAPLLGVDARGHEYLASLAASPCGDVYTPYLVVASRAGSTGTWSTPVRVAQHAWKYGFDDAPSLAVSPSGVLHVAWTRGLRQTAAAVVASSSTDGGRHWSQPVVVARPSDSPHTASIAAGPGGLVVVAGIDAKHGVWIARSVDGGRTFGAVRTAAPLAANPSSLCALAGLSPLPTEERECAGPNPVVLLHRNRVVVVYGDAGDVLASVLDGGLRPLFRSQVNPPDRGHAQQFVPAATVDPTSGVLWACWYDTTFDPHAQQAWYTCAASKDGRMWSEPLRAAGVETDTRDLYMVQGQNALSTSVAARNGVAHAFWIDGRFIDVGYDVFTAGLRERAAFAAKP